MAPFCFLYLYAYIHMRAHKKRTIKFFSKKVSMESMFSEKVENFLKKVLAT